MWSNYNINQSILKASPVWVGLFCCVSLSFYYLKTKVALKEVYKIVGLAGETSITYLRDY